MRFDYIERFLNTAISSGIDQKHTFSESNSPLFVGKQAELKRWAESPNAVPLDRLPSSLQTQDKSASNTTSVCHILKFRRSSQTFTASSPAIRHTWLGENGLPSGLTSHRLTRFNT
eukprot:1884728-Pyramimonas_sp.AAC.1